jgi:hypothetical protein
MVSGLRAVRNGVAQWAVIHNAQEGRFDLDVRGMPPSELAPIRDRLMQQQVDEGGEEADVDLVFDIPVELGAALCGFRHDGLPDGVPAGTPTPGFTALQARRRSLVERVSALFGRS